MCIWCPMEKVAGPHDPGVLEQTWGVGPSSSSTRAALSEHLGKARGSHAGGGKPDFGQKKPEGKVQLLLL